MNVASAASLTHRLVDKLCEGTTLTLHQQPVKSPDGIGISHAVWMLIEIETGRVQAEKAHRWLGWAQAMLAVSNVGTLEQFKVVNLLS